MFAGYIRCSEEDRPQAGGIQVVAGSDAPVKVVDNIAPIQTVGKAIFPMPKLLLDTSKLLGQKMLIMLVEGDQNIVPSGITKNLEKKMIITGDSMEIPGVIIGHRNSDETYDFPYGDGSDIGGRTFRLCFNLLGDTYYSSSFMIGWEKSPTSIVSE